MKGINWLIVSMLLVVVLISSAPSKIFGFQDNGIGEYVNVAPLRHGDWKTPPGHYGLMALYANKFLSQELSNGNYQVTWAYLVQHLNEYFIVDVRLNTFYCLSHIVGAINIPYNEVAEPENLDKLPTDKPILLYCGSGLLSSQVAPILGMMGYQVRILTTAFGSVPSSYKVSGCQ